MVNDSLPKPNPPTSNQQNQSGQTVPPPSTLKPSSVAGIQNQPTPATVPPVSNEAVFSAPKPITPSPTPVVSPAPSLSKTNASGGSESFSPPSMGKFVPPPPPSAQSRLSQQPAIPSKPTNIAAAPPLPPLPGSAQQPVAPESKSSGGLPPSGKAPVKDSSKKQPMFAKIKKTPLRFLPLIIGGIILLLVVGLVAARLLGGGNTNTVGSTDNEIETNNSNTVNTNSNVGSVQVSQSGKQTTLTYWGLWESREALSQVLQDFESQNPGVIVNYVKHSPKDYRERLQAAIASGQGPDIFRFHASWTPMFQDDLAPMPSSVMSANEFTQDFYPVAVEQLQVNNQVVGLPLMYDGLLLYYNKDILTAANAQPPQTWSQLRELAVKLTVSNNNNIERAGAAIGSSTNVEHFSDILGLLMLQNGADPSDPTSKAAQEVIEFYTNFVKVDGVWSPNLPNSTVAFARGDVAMMLAPSWRAHEVVAMNPELNFAVTTSPKLAGRDISWASYWAEGVNARSSNKKIAWQLLSYMSSPTVLRKLYSEAAQTRSFGEPYPRVSMANDLAGEKYLEPLLSDAPKASSWYLNSFTHDNGINDLMIKYYEDAVSAVLSGKQPSDVMATVARGTDQILRQYGVISQ